MCDRPLAVGALGALGAPPTAEIPGSPPGHGPSGDYALHTMHFSGLILCTTNYSLPYALRRGTVHTLLATYGLYSGHIIVLNVSFKLIVCLRDCVVTSSSPCV